MQITRNSHKIVRQLFQFVFGIAALLAFCISGNTAKAQACPPNIDFETGSFNGWICYTGTTAAENGQNIISLNQSGGPVAGRHTMLSANAGDGIDDYGGFPVNCPNGSGNSIKLGNDQGGGQAEGISYEFTIPANEDKYTLIYHYAVVFQDPNHLQNEQPRMQIEITNVTDNTIIECASFAFFPFGSALPGFQLSTTPGSNTPVWFKNWSAVSINLNGNAGKTIRLFFKTADCTFRRHFGYAYIDVNSECSGTFVGATYCPDDSAINVVAPYGYQSYTWYDSSLTTILGTQQVLTLSPPPPAGITVAVKLTPYNGYGCPQTLYAVLVDTLTAVANAGPDVLSCNLNPVTIGTFPKPGFVYSWTPTAGLSNTNISNPLASPTITTTYILKIKHDGGGCLTTDSVVVGAAVIDTSLQLTGRSVFCIGTGDSAVLKVQPADRIQWFRNGIPITGAASTIYRVTQTGAYHAMLFDNSGCNLATRVEQITISSIPVISFISPTNPNQCLVGNEFSFTNTSTNTIGGMQYNWAMGDGTVLNTKDIKYAYTRAGNYNVQLIVSTTSVCADTGNFEVQIYTNAIGDFTVDRGCIGLPVKTINNTIDTGSSPVNYLWDLGNGQVSNVRNPPTQVYQMPGAYLISLSVNTAQCPLPYHTIRRTLIIDKPKPGISYPFQYAVVNIPITLQARLVGESVFWSPGINLDSRTSFTPEFEGSADQMYTIEIKSRTGCVTIDSQLVKIVKQVDIFVPTAFTPNSDGINDLLRPIMFGIKELRYFRIYNRVGQLVYETRSTDQGWDGVFKGIAQHTQAFVWIVDALGGDGKIYSKKGSSVLLR